MLNVPVPLIGVSVGAPVRVNGPALAPVAVFLTVTVPSFGVRLPGVVVKPVVVNVTVAPMTLNELFRVTVPPGVVTLTFRCPRAAPLAIVNVAVTVVLFTTTMLLTATLAPETVTADVPVRDVPVKVTFTAAPREPEFGETAVRVGALAVDANSTAPASTAPFDFRRVPKKSSAGAALKLPVKPEVM